mgnify:CR=1 FL=1
MDYARMIVQIRARLNLSQEQLAKMLNVAFATVNRWENNKATPSRKHRCILENLCKENDIEI